MSLKEDYSHLDQRFTFSKRFEILFQTENVIGTSQRCCKILLFDKRYHQYVRLRQDSVWTDGTPCFSDSEIITLLQIVLPQKQLSFLQTMACFEKMHPFSIELAKRIQKEFGCNHKYTPPLWPQSQIVAKNRFPRDLNQIYPLESLQKLAKRKPVPDFFCFANEWQVSFRNEFSYVKWTQQERNSFAEFWVSCARCKLCIDLINCCLSLHSLFLPSYVLLNIVEMLPSHNVSTHPLFKQYDLIPKIVDINEKRRKQKEEVNIDENKSNF